MVYWREHLDVRVKRSTYRFKKYSTLFKSSTVIFEDLYRSRKCF